MLLRRSEQTVAVLARVGVNYPPPSPCDPPVLDDTAAAQPATAGLRRRRPSVYLTLGTIFNRESGDLFARMLAGLARLD
jgi:UDP:flavonoid glycosyltransferase YjiC (YdhE family)